MGSNRFAVHGLGYVESLAVLREYRGRGIARHLLDEAFRFLPEWQAARAKSA